MKTKSLILVAACAASLAACTAPQKQQSQQEPPALKDAFAGHFLIGSSVNVWQAAGQDTLALPIIKRHFNTIVAENCMKSEEIHPEKDRYYFDQADQFVAFGEENNMFIVGHCLIWHSQLAKWFCVDDNGQYVSPDELRERMRDHIHTIVGRYKGRIKGWDVVNEMIESDGSYRKSPFYEILGEEYIPLAFQYAHEADPEAELYLNDFSMSDAGKRDAYIALIKKLQERGLRIDAIGMQAHVGMDYPDITEFEKSLTAFAATGIKVMITEWDQSALPTVHRGANISDTVAYRAQLNPYPDGLPDSVATAWNNRCEDFFRLFLKHSDKISRVNVWGVADGDSWKNNWPIRGRKEYPLLFDRNYQMKPCMVKLANELTNKQ